MCIAAHVVKLLNWHANTQLHISWMSCDLLTTCTAMRSHMINQMLSYMILHGSALHGLVDSILKHASV